MSRANPLVESEWLEANLDRAEVRTVDLRDLESHAAGHIPGASHLDLSELGTSHGACDNVVLAPSEFERLMGRLGLSSRDTIVAYDDQWGLAAARFLWALHYYGHGEAHVLNGGWDAWQETGRPISDSVRTGQPRPFVARAVADVSADSEWIAERISSRDVVLLDTRAQAEFDRGHLPGAVMWDWFNAVPAGGWAASREPVDLRAEWAEMGVRAEDEVVVYCRSGMRAAHTYMVLRHAGFPRVRLYDGSWQEWSERSGADR